jgi:GTP-binding protein
VPLPVVAIVGRPNVGKSALFNRLAGRRIAIVEPTSGVTRDRLTAEVAHAGRRFELTDTGGMGIHDVDGLDADIRRQIDEALRQADVIVFVVDARDGIVPLDRQVAERLRHVGKPVFLAANKVETPALEQEAAAFFALGLGAPLCVSAQHGIGREDLLDRLVVALPTAPSAEESNAPAAAPLLLAIVGRRNVGKSTFVNALAREERMIVSERPGTTRDAVDVRFERDGRTFVAIDTAGVRRRASIADSIEFYSQARTDQSIRRADVVVLMLDAAVPLGLIEKQIAAAVVEHHKPCVLAVNKWDLHGNVPTEEFRRYIDVRLRGLAYAPIVFTTSKTGRNVASVVQIAQVLHRQARTRVTTGELNRVVMEALEIRRPRPRGGRIPKVFYATQTDVAPPTILLFVNDPAIFDEGYRRYLANHLRGRLPFAEVPIELRWRARRSRAPKNGV